MLPVKRDIRKSNQPYVPLSEAGKREAARHGDNEGECRCKDCGCGASYDSLLDSGRGK